ncbi:uncharacterized protein BO97DRAFT_478319 [Aspergillus homomorphus CBS 101889]|uniref:Uncharacterized protein n=1 Tax=Aspergillus homomorphus (strain CBS 101889) TaxID=1450537 RepID=A0A395HWZ0_ASPHC|nr:hypothetical protein BO97DRAFT_478319 [Aspergillus homomorphus CBS 101889]RAL11933.1 hypothetical protein BO97DRAFT_478319 [Aspergillus homomorphus CBS 101889]
MSCLSGLRLKHRFERSSLPNITNAARTPWKSIGPANEHLLSELESLYWYGVKLELENIIRTLNIWQQPEFTDVTVEDEHDNEVHGFETFIDQVSQETRAFARRYGDDKAAKAASQKKTLFSTMSNTEVKEALLKAQAEQTEYQRSNIETKNEVRRNTENIVSSSAIQERARILLQAVGFLDMDKLIEHRPPLEDLGFWARPAIPQLTFSGFDGNWNAQFEPLKCSDCTSIIRGSMFTKDVKLDPANQRTVCEDCYRRSDFGREQYTKVYKHCILAETITPELSRNLCRCLHISRLDSKGLPRGFFPISKEDNHVSAPFTKRCKILELNTRVALAKYDGLQSTVRDHMEEDKKPHGSGPKVNGRARDGEHKPPKKVTLRKDPKAAQLPLRTDSGKRNSLAHDQDSNIASAKEARADDDIPLFFRQFAQQYPFGNVHMALRVGPLVIENGVAHTKKGALVTIRELPIFQEKPSSGSLTSRHPSLAIGGEPNRRLWRQQRPVGNPKRYKAIMKQVVGVPFTSALSGSSHAEQESEIIWLIVAASRGYFDHPGLPAKDQRKRLDAALQQIMDKLKALLEPRANVYLQRIAQKLLDPNTTITWSAISNNCQTFCNSLIDMSTFEPLFDTTSACQNASAASPLYLMSFVCPQEGYLRNRVRTKYDVPSGLTEEYLLRFHFGRHDEADVLDTLQEYWYDWGAFGGTLYKYQDLFPWDCTEAYQQRHPKFCGSCNLAKHIWAFPFDAWSIIALHLHRTPQMYATANSGSWGKNDGSWMRDRLTVLTALSFLNRGAAAMAKSKKFVQGTRWLHSAEKGLRQADPSLTRVKLGGIHRAQPYSHYYEAGTYSHYFLAKWASRPRAEQIEEYEVLRNERARRSDFGGSAGGRFSLPGDSTAENEPAGGKFWGFEGVLYDIERLHGNDTCRGSGNDASAHPTHDDEDPDSRFQPSSDLGGEAHPSHSSNGVSAINDNKYDDSQNTAGAPAGPAKDNQSSRQDHRDTAHWDTIHPGKISDGAGHGRDTQSSTQSADKAEIRSADAQDDSSKKNQSGVDDGGLRASYRYGSDFTSWKGHSKYQHPGHVEHSWKTNSSGGRSAGKRGGHADSEHSTSSLASSGYGHSGDTGGSHSTSGGGRSSSYGGGRSSSGGGYQGGWVESLINSNSGSSHHGSSSTSSYGGSNSYSGSSGGGSSSYSSGSSSSYDSGSSSSYGGSSSYDSGSSYSSSWN